MDTITIFFIIFLTCLSGLLVYFKLRLDKQYHKDIPYMPKRYTKIATGAFIVQIVGSIINLAVTPFPYSTAVIFILMGISISTILWANHKRSNIINEHWKQTSFNSKDETQGAKT